MFYHYIVYVYIESRLYVYTCILCSVKYDQFIVSYPLFSLKKTNKQTKSSMDDTTMEKLSSESWLIGLRLYTFTS